MRSSSVLVVVVRNSYSASLLKAIESPSRGSPALSPVICGGKRLDELRRDDEEA
jgi:hypothetical protein